MGFSINSVTVNGNLTRDPELRAFPSGTAVCQLRIAHNSRRKDPNSGEWVDVPHFFDVSVWAGQGEWIAKNLAKGAGVVVHGQLRWREYTDRDGNKRQAVDINAQDVIPMGKRDNSGGGGGFSARSDIPADPADFGYGQPSQGQPQPAGAGAADDIPF